MPQERFAPGDAAITAGLRIPAEAAAEQRAQYEFRMEQHHRRRQQYAQHLLEQKATQNFRRAAKRAAF